MTLDTYTYMYIYTYIYTYIYVYVSKVVRFGLLCGILNFLNGESRGSLAYREQKVEVRRTETQMKAKHKKHMQPDHLSWSVREGGG